MQMLPSIGMFLLSSLLNNKSTPADAPATPTLQTAQKPIQPIETGGSAANRLFSDTEDPEVTRRRLFGG